MPFLDGADRESEKVSDVFHHRLEFSLLDVGPVLRAKRGPLPFLVSVISEFHSPRNQQQPEGLLLNPEQEPEKQKAAQPMRS